MRLLAIILVMFSADHVNACPVNLHFDEICRGDLPYENVLPNCLARAEKGDPKHITILANFLSPQDGHGDLDSSNKWFLKAIEQNYAPAMYYYATKTMRAYPTGRETAHAKLMLYKGADLGDINSIAQLGYELGAGIGEFKDDKNINESMRLLLKASKGRSGKAQRLLVSKYRTKKNYVEAYAWNYVVKQGDVNHRSFKHISKYLRPYEIEKAIEKATEYLNKFDSSICK